ncbi:unnamed protein product [Cochlearia groenlandica]
MSHKERQIWLPSHVIQDPLLDHSNKHQNSVKNHHQGSVGVRRPATTPLRQVFPLKNNNTREKQQSKWQKSKGEERMQAFFLVSPGRTTPGTGVFIPATASHLLTKTQKVCSPVLLPTRVVQALNLKVHNNGIHISPRSEIRENGLNKKSEMVVTTNNIEVEIPMDSPEILLPEEWIY